MRFSSRAVGWLAALVVGCVLGALVSAVLVPLIERPKTDSHAPPAAKTVKRTASDPPPPLRDPPKDVRRRVVEAPQPAAADTQQVVRPALPPEGTNLTPQWTQPLAMPAKHPIPPDPFTPPPMAVDPARKPEPAVERHGLP